MYTYDHEQFNLYKYMAEYPFHTLPVHCQQRVGAYITSAYKIPVI